MMVLGFDFGMRYIGVATGQKITKSASPLCSILATDGIPNWQEIADLIADWQPEALIVGLPLQMDGSTQEITLCANKFANRLYAKFKLPVYRVDERLSTWEAKQTVSKNDLKTLNAKAAAILLEQWLNEQN